MIVGNRYTWNFIFKNAVKLLDIVQMRNKGSFKFYIIKLCAIFTLDVQTLYNSDLKFLTLVFFDIQP